MSVATAAWTAIAAARHCQVQTYHRSQLSLTDYGTGTMAGWGYGDWQARSWRADWILPTRSGSDGHDVWSLVHDHLIWLSDPAGIAQATARHLASCRVDDLRPGHGIPRIVQTSIRRRHLAWEMQGAHEIAVARRLLAIGTIYDWLLTKETISIDISRLGKPTLQDEVIHGWFGRGHRGSVDRGNKGQIPVRWTAARIGLAAPSHCETILFRLCDGCWSVAKDIGLRQRIIKRQLCAPPTLHASRSACHGYAGLAVEEIFS